MKDYQMNSMSNGMSLDRGVSLMNDFDDADNYEISISMYSGGKHEDMKIDKPDVIKKIARGTKEEHMKKMELQQQLTDAVIEILKEADQKILDKVNDIVKNFK